MNSPAPWINDAILTWQKEGIKLQPGAMPFFIAEVEQWMGYLKNQQGIYRSIDS